VEGKLISPALWTKIEAIEKSEERQDINIICEYKCEVCIIAHVVELYWRINWFNVYNLVDVYKH